MSQFRMDIVTVFHCDTNFQQHLGLRDMIDRHEPKGGWRFIAVDNRRNNRGFAKGCNFGAFDERADAPIIGFLNPDVIVRGSFMDQVADVLRKNRRVITGNRFGKEQRELDIWGVRDWVCGATFFVRRDWFTEVGGFDENYVWSFEETDLIRRAEEDNKICESFTLPLEHASPDQDSPEDAAYKRYHFDRSSKLFYQRWKKARA